MHLKLIQTHFVLILFVVHAHLLLTNSFFLFKPLNRNTVNQERDQVTTKQKGKKKCKPAKAKFAIRSQFFIVFFFLALFNQFSGRINEIHRTENPRNLNKIKLSIK